MFSRSSFTLQRFPALALTLALLAAFAAAAPARAEEVSTTTTLVSSPSRQQVDNPVALTAAVTASVGTPTGSVTFSDNGSLLGTLDLDDNGQATWTTWTLTPGVHWLTATYNPAAGFSASQSTAINELIYDGTDWNAIGVATGPDGNTDILWNGPGNQAALWWVTPAFSWTSMAYGPFAGWTATAISIGADANTRILWNNTDGQAGLWVVTPTGAVVTTNAYGPYPGGTAVGIATGADNSTRILWDFTDGSTALQVVDVDLMQAAYNTLNPPSGWTPISVSVGSDGDTRILLASSSGGAQLWVVDPSDNITSQTWGPFGGWFPIAIGTGPDNSTRILWDGPDWSQSLWVVTPSHSVATAAQPTNGSAVTPEGTIISTVTTYTYYLPTGWVADAISVGPDNNSHLLWMGPYGMMGLWTVYSDFSWDGEAY